MSRKDVVTLHVVSPCEHGVKHHIEQLHEGAVFSVPECHTKSGGPRHHVVTAAKYPETVRRT